MDGAVPNIRRDVIKARAIVSELEHNLTSTQMMVSDIHRAVVKGKQGGNGNDPSVGDTWAVSTAE